MARQALRKSYRILPLKLEDKEEALGFFRRFFLKDEPISQAVNLMKDKSSCPEVEDYCFHQLDFPINFKAVSEDGQIIGLKLNSLTKRGVEEHKTGVVDKQGREILDFLSFVDGHFDAFSHYPKLDKVLNGIVVSVDPEWRGQEIGKELMRRTWDAVGEQKCGLMKNLATSLYTAKMLTSLGWRRVFSLDYKDYRGSEGIRSKVPPPHKTASIFVRENLKD